MTIRGIERIIYDIKGRKTLQDIAALQKCIEELEKHPTEEAVFWKGYTESVIVYINGNISGAIERLSKEASELDRLGLSRTRADYEYQIGNYKERVGRFKEAEEHLKTALKIREGLQSAEDLFLSLNSLGILYNACSDIPRSIEYLMRANQVAKSIDDDYLLARNYNNLGMAYKKVGESAEAIRFFLQSLTVFEKVENDHGKASVSVNLGGLYLNIGDLNTAIKYLEQGKDLHERIGNLHGAAAAYSNLAQTYSELKNEEIALDYYFRSKELYKTSGDEKSVIRQLLWIIKSLITLGRATEARSTYEEMESYDMINDPDLEMILLVSKARVLQEEGKLDEAKRAFLKNLEIATKRQLNTNILNSYLNLRDLAERSRDFDEYLKYNKLYQELESNIRGSQQQRKIAVQEMEQEMKEERNEREKEKAILYSTLPKYVADRVISGQKVADSYDSASVLFLDIVGFTKLSADKEANIIVELLDAIFSRIDSICKDHQVTKIKTIGDAYLAVCGVPEFLKDHSLRIAKVADRIHRELPTVQRIKFKEYRSILDLKFRIGLHCGPLTAGVIGKERLQYDIWGDTVNTAARMEQTGEAGRVHVSDAFKQAIAGNSEFQFEERGEIEVKGKGKMKTFFLSEAIT